MEKWEKALLQMAVASGGLFAWMIGIEVGMLPAEARGDGVLSRWQVWLLAGLVLIATRDFVSQVRCHSCRSREQISVLGLLPFRELTCRKCLSWDAGIFPVDASVLSVAEKQAPGSLNSGPDAN